MDGWTSTFLHTQGWPAAAGVGRGTRLCREMKKKVWPVFQQYRAQLNERGKKEYVDLIRDARQLAQCEISERGPSIATGKLEAKLDRMLEARRQEPSEPPVGASSRT